MTSQSPRIYIYKITFEEVLYYYYGVHKEKRFNEEYWGSPVTHKDFWEVYTPIKEIIREFPYTDGGWLEANNFEKSLIKPVYNADPLCLNENCGGIISLDVCREAGKIGGKIGGKIVAKKLLKFKLGIHGRSTEERLENCIKGGQMSLKLKKGVHARSKEQRIIDGAKGGKRVKELGKGFHGLTKEQMTENGKRGGKTAGKKCKESKKGIFGRTKEQMFEDRSKGGKISGKRAYELKTGIHGLTEERRLEITKKAGEKGGKISTSQVWECTVTGYRTNAAALSRYQKKRGIDTSNRIRIQ
jgi:hypothetical protein